MSRLRHPIRAIREPFGTAGLIVAMIALVAALGGTAFAAAKLNSTQKKEVEKIAKKFAGKPGAPGANGTNGSPGAKGDPGAPGTNGTNGAPGESVTVKTLAKGEEGCTQGGAKFSNATGTAKACNGTSGFTKTLPSKETETGVWNIPPITEGSEPSGHLLYATVASFPIPLSAALDAAHVHFINAENMEVTEYSAPGTPVKVNSTACLGSVEAPTATQGNLCVYAGTEFNLELASNVILTPTQAPGAGTVGALALAFISAVEASANGSWAVTAP